MIKHLAFNFAAMAKPIRKKRAALSIVSGPLNLLLTHASVDRNGSKQNKRVNLG